MFSSHVDFRVRKIKKISRSRHAHIEHSSFRGHGLCIHICTQGYHSFDGANHENSAKLMPLSPMQGTDADRVLIRRHFSGFGVPKQIDRDARGLQAFKSKPSKMPISGNDTDILGL